MIPVSWISDYYTQIISLHLAVLSECFKILLAQVAEKVDELQCIYLVENYSVSYNIVLGSCSPTFRSWKEAKRFHLESISWSGKSNWCSDKTLQRGRGQILYDSIFAYECSNIASRFICIYGVCNGYCTAQISAIPKFYNSHVKDLDRGCKHLFSCQSITNSTDQWWCLAGLLFDTCVLLS